MRIEARAHRKRIRDHIVFIVLSLAMGGWFAYDGYVTYPKENRLVAEENEARLAEDPTFVAEPEPYEGYQMAQQKVLAVACGGFALVFVLFLIRALRNRIVIDDEGLSVDGQAVIPYDAMTSLQTAQWREKGWVDLAYDQDGRSRTVRLDSFKIGSFDELVAAICERKAFETLPPRGEADEEKLQISNDE